MPAAGTYNDTNEDVEGLDRHGLAAQRNDTEWPNWGYDDGRISKHGIRAFSRSMSLLRQW